MIKAGGWQAAGPCFFIGDEGAPRRSIAINQHGRFPPPFYLQHIMTDYQARIDACMAETQHADAATLADIHSRLLQMAHVIRVRTRWGNRTDYIIKIKEAHAVDLTSGTAHEIKPNGLGRYRIEFGANVADGIRVHLSRWEPGPLRQWGGWDDPVIVERVWAWLRKFQPAAEALLKIDMQLLEMQGGSHE